MEPGPVQSAEQWGEFWWFALTFNGYSFMRVNEAGEPELFAARVRDYYKEHGELPLKDLRWLRTALFVEQRKTRATNDSGDVERDYVIYLQALLDGIRVAVDRQHPQLVQTKRLRAADVPRPDPPAPWDGRDVGTWIFDPELALRDVWQFARTFDPFGYFAVDDVRGRLEDFARSVKNEFLVTGEVPRLSEIGMLRACLAYEERIWCSWSDDAPVMTVADVGYVSALLEAIRSRLQ